MSDPNDEEGDEIFIVGGIIFIVVIIILAILDFIMI